MRVNIELDKHSEKILQKLAKSRGGNRSLVLREALASLADDSTYREKCLGLVHQVEMKPIRARTKPSK